MMYPIKIVSEGLNIPPSSLRLWEKKGLISPARNDRGWRMYSDEDINIVRQIIIYCYLMPTQDTIDEYREMVEKLECVI